MGIVAERKQDRTFAERGSLCKIFDPKNELEIFTSQYDPIIRISAGCAEGGCGACTVMISRWVVPGEDGGDGDGGGNGNEEEDEGGNEGKIVHYAANACLMPVLAADGAHITTIEGIGSVRKDTTTGNGGLHPLQSAMVDLHGSQCGFCTPGIIVAIYALLANKPEVKYVEEHLDGNLCRCTGYRPIWDAARSVCVDATSARVGMGCGASGGSGEPVGPCGTPCRECPERATCDLECNVADGGGGGAGNSEKEEEEKKLEDSNGCGGGSGSGDMKGDKMCCTSSQDKMTTYLATLPAESDGGPRADWREQPDRMFPDDLKTKGASSSEANRPLVVMDQSALRGGTWFKPTTLVELLGLLRTYAEDGGGCKIVVGNTEVGIGEYVGIEM